LKREQMGMERQESLAEHQARLNEIAADAEAKARDRRQAADEFALQSADRAADRASDERLAEIKIAADLAKQTREFEHDEQQMTMGQMHEAEQTTVGQEHEQRQEAGRQEFEERKAASQPLKKGETRPKPKGTPGPGGGLSMGKPKPTPF
jgi:hypothetical protein